jgi:hypothetical protein
LFFKLTLQLRPANIMDDFMEDYAREEAMAGADDVNFGAAMDATNGGDSAPFNGVEIPLRGSDEEVISDFAPAEPSACAGDRARL